MSNTEFFGLSDHYTPHEEPARSRLTSRRQLVEISKNARKPHVLTLGITRFFDPSKIL